jgi:hypothetical protein
MTCEIMPPRIVDALSDADMWHLWDSQPFVDRPWENPSNRQLGAAITAMSALVMEMRASTALSAGQAAAAAAASQLSATSCRLAAEESDANNRGVSNAWEQQAASGIAAHLQDGEIVAVNYKWRHKNLTTRDNLNWGQRSIAFNSVNHRSLTSPLSGSCFIGYCPLPRSATLALSYGFSSHVGRDL